MCLMKITVVHDKLSMISMVTTQEGVTALYYASVGGHVTVVKMLLERGTDVNIHNKVRLLWTLLCMCMLHSVSWLYFT